MILIVFVMLPILRKRYRQLTRLKKHKETKRRLLSIKRSKNTKRRQILKKPKLEILYSVLYAWFSVKRLEGKTCDWALDHRTSKKVYLVLDIEFFVCFLLYGFKNLKLVTEFECWMHQERANHIVSPLLDTLSYNGN